MHFVNRCCRHAFLWCCVLIKTVFARIRVLLFICSSALIRALTPTLVGKGKTGRRGWSAQLIRAAYKKSLQLCFQVEYGRELARLKRRDRTRIEYVMCRISAINSV
ncbi:hypothetical protein VCUG_00526 [Vavraia culicis subsp. floridensis]|uniref:Uncharacterized protein n=1 Tax=Vavraia culicis (isolate floridensis) TaxID=948595 RepID=L2GXE7_VAVCU|nr:uncharacterized protein VCUG_00526 [Vavraia culicis subsp. floridensis]ELA47943.1 hypothetical protein VCUG_00526 [Vavraia culicis subsp. floridensis]